jgi:hypothetical protein
LKLYINGQELEDEKPSIKDSGIIEAGGIIEVDVLIKVSIEVMGKGKDYSSTVEVKMTDEIDILRQKVHFFKSLV